LALAVVPDLREHRALAGEDELADFETDVLAGFVLARASAGLVDSTIRNDVNHLELIRDWFGRPLSEMQPVDADTYSELPNVSPAPNWDDLERWSAAGPPSSRNVTGGPVAGALDPPIRAAIPKRRASRIAHRCRDLSSLSGRVERAAVTTAGVRWPIARSSCR